MLISLLVLSPEQIFVPFWVKYGSFYRGPITLLEPLVVLIGSHKDKREKTQTRSKRNGRGGMLARYENWVELTFKDILSE
jgi:hypothetical protein